MVQIPEPLLGGSRILDGCFEGRLCHRQAICMLIGKGLNLKNGSLTSMVSFALKPSSLQQCRSINHPIIVLVQNTFQVTSHLLGSETVHWIIILHIEAESQQNGKIQFAQCIVFVFFIFHKFHSFQEDIFFVVLNHLRFDLFLILACRCIVWIASISFFLLFLALDFHLSTCICLGRRFRSSLD